MTSEPIASIISLARATKSSFFAKTPFLSQRLSSKPTLTLPQANIAAATKGIWFLPRENALNVQFSGTLFTIAMNVFKSSGAPHGTPMHN